MAPRGAYWQYNSRDGGKLEAVVRGDVVLTVDEGGLIGNVTDSRKREVYLSDYMRRAGKVAVALSTPYASTPDVTAEWQAALDDLEDMGGGDLMMPAGQIAINTTTLLVPARVRIVGLPWINKVLIGNGYAGTQSVFKPKTVSSDGSLSTEGVEFKDIWFDGANRIFPLWLTNAAGAPITDPEADYRVGGCLAPTTFASISLTVTNGAVTGVTINSGGSGYVYKPTLWVTGDGYGAVIDLTISGGAVTGYFIVSGGVGYTSATAEVAGGGANPATALFAADRRNSNWNTHGALIELIKMVAPAVRRCRFTNYGGMVIIDAGCDARAVEYNEFEACGSPDSEAVLIWSQSHGNPASPPAYFRHTTNGVFKNNRIKNCRRSVATISDHDGDYSENIIDGWGESCFFVTEHAKKYTVSRNKAKNGTMTDIVCRFVEGTHDANVFDNVIENVDGPAVSIIGDGSLVSRNTIIAPAAFTETYPFGPYSERVGYALNSAAVAGRPINKNNRAAVLIANATDNASDAPKSSRLRDNTLVANDNGNYYTHAVSFSKGAANSIGPIYMDGGVDITQSLSSLLFDPVAADACLDKDKAFRVSNNPGHVSSGAVLIHETITSGTTGLKKWTFGFRPRVVFINARANVSGIAHVVAVFADEEARNPGTTGGTNTTGGLLRFAATSAPAVAQGSENTGGILIATTAGTVFQASAIGFSSDGWTMNIFTNTNDCIFEVMGIP